MTYIDGFVIPVPRKNLAAYRKLARFGRRLWAKHGCLDYREYVAEDLRPKGSDGKPMPGFPRLARLKAGETVVFSFIEYRNRKHRDAVNARVMKDPSMASMGDQTMPFDMKRFAFAGFSPLVVMGKPRARRGRSGAR